MLAAMKPSTRALSLLCLILLVACGSPLDNPDKLRDSTGLEFGWDCSESSVCEVTSAPAISSGCEFPVWGRSWGRFYEFCSACASPSGGWAAVSFHCRPVACGSDGDCPQIATGMRDSDAIREDIYECVDGLCQNADTPAMRCAGRTARCSATPTWVGRRRSSSTRPRFGCGSPR
jgi:hypothetical protein